MNKLLRIFVVLGLIGSMALSFISLKTSASGNIYYVAKNGSDSNNGTIGSPWLTIQHAANIAVAGDTVEVETGTYNEYVAFNHAGTAANPITFENYPNETPIIDGIGLPNPGSAVGLVSFWASYINFNGFTIQNYSWYQGVLVVTSYVNLSNLTITNTEYSGIKLEAWYSYSGHVTVNNCNLYNCDVGDNDEIISIMPMNNVVIENCYLHSNLTNRDGIDAKDGCNNVSIHNNEITTLSSGETGIYIDCQGTTQDSISIYDNKIHDYNGDGIVLGSEGGGGALTNCNIYNNLIYNVSEAIQAQPYSFNKTAVIINNTIYNCVVGIDWDDTAYTYQINCVTRNNIIYTTAANVLINYPYYASGGVTIDHNLFYDVSGTYNTIYGTSYIKANPLLTNPTSDFSLQNSSPAIGAGSATSAPTLDYIGTTRPNPPSIGAYDIIYPSVTTGSASSITVNSASVHEEVTNIGTSDVTAWGTNYGTSLSYGLNYNNSGDESSGFSWDDPLGSLSAATLYHYRGYATNSTGTNYGADATFLTLPNAPTSLGKTAGNTQVAFTWTKASGGSGTTIYTQIQYSTSGYPSAYTDGTTGVAWTTGSIGTVTGLTNGTLYYFSVFTKATNSGLTEYSTASAQTTATPVGTTTTTTTTGTTTTTTTTSSIVIPTMSLTGASLITNTTARISGIVSNTGGDNPTVIVFWDTTNKYQGTWANGDYPTSPSQPQGQVSFYYDVTGLTASTTYYYTATGTNSAGTAWTSPVLHFTTTGGTTTTTTTQTTIPIPTNATGVINWIPLFFAAGIVFIIVMMAKNANQSNMIQVVIEIAILITIGLIILAQVNSAIHL